MERGAGMKAELIAPCGMNCNVCRAVLDKSGRAKQCPGCVPRGKGCMHCGGMCKNLRDREVRFCHECEDFPCKKLKHLDKRYRTKYNMSMIDNLNYIRENSVQKLIKREEIKWRCKKCGGVICCHNGVCYSCLPAKPKKMKKEKNVGKFNSALIAPCGMNCGFCSAYLAMSRGHEKRKGMSHCPGCRARNKDCSFIKKRCPSGLRKNLVQFCYECAVFPCENLVKIAKRYETDYEYDFIEALKFIRDKGMPAFLRRERKRWKCPNCGDVICVHNGKCYRCQKITSWKG
jgi:hypothetical protein